MKNINYILIAIALSLSNVSCKKGISDSFDYGKIENHVYINDFFKMTITIPQDWDIQFDSEKKALEEQLKAADITTANLLMAFQFELAKQTDPNLIKSNFTLLTENIKDSSINDGIDYLKESKKTMMQSQMPITINDTIESIEIDEKTFYYFDAILDMGGVEVNQRYIATIASGFSLVYIASYGTDEQLERLMDVLKSIKFN